MGEPDVRLYNVHSEISEFGRSRRLIECPFCHEKFWAYTWSLAGSGKKCPRCKAFHTINVAREAR